MIDATPQRRPSAFARRRPAAIFFAAILTLALVPAASAATSAPAPATSTTPSITMSSTAISMANSILSWLNRDRAAAGLRPLRAWGSLQSIANTRSANMASSQVLSHSAAGGDPGKAISSAGLQWYSWGEIIGETSYPWGSQAAANLYHMWFNSPLHHQIMFSNTSNYIGIGIARGSDGTTWSSILFTESTDHTRPIAYNGTSTVRGTSITFRWSGRDPLLQTHTAGIKGFNILYRVNSGAWTQIRTATTATYLSMTSRRHGYTYSFRVQAVDRRGNLSPWTAVKKVYVP